MLCFALPNAAPQAVKGTLGRGVRRMHYHTYEMAHAALAPVRFQSKLVRRAVTNPFNPMAYTKAGRMVAAACEVFETASPSATASRPGASARPGSSGSRCRSRRRSSSRTPFSDLLHFDRDERVCGKRYDPKVLLVAPMSGHYATLLRGTVQAMIQEHNLYITDWRDARDDPAGSGAVRPRRLHRLHHRLHPLRRHQHPRGRGLPAFGAGAGGRRRHGGAQRPLPPGLAHADGRADRHAPQPDRWSTSTRRRAASTGSSAT